MMIAALAGVMLIMVLYIALKERETSRKLSMMEAGMDGLNREIFKISKEIEAVEKRLDEKYSDVAENREQSEPLEQIVESRLKPYMLEAEDIRRQMEKVEQLQERVERIDAKIRQALFANEHSAPDEQKILQLHAQGMDSGSIAKQLRLGKGEVELVLKFSKLNRFQ
ncbi:putative periplasmic protein [Hydrogenimonas sp.]|nr:putative periplasmic protein [Hydrogenimonas sp.]